MATVSAPVDPLKAEQAFAMYLRPAEKFVPVEEYLDTGYEPDMDYLDGHLGERHVGETEHSALQNALITLLNKSAREWGIRVYPECRLQVREDRFRVPDVLVLPRGYKPPRIVREAPLLCVEVLSPRDTWRDLMTRTDDYARMGVGTVWCFDPKRTEVFAVLAGQRSWLTESDPLTVAGTNIVILRSEIDAELAD